MNQMRGGLGNCVSMLLETLIACQRWGCVPSTLSVLQRLHTIHCFQLTCFLLHTVSVQITDYLEQRCYKELRREQYGYAKVIVLIYRRLLVSCKEQM
jgi:hypothetical protein